MGNSVRVRMARESNDDEDAKEMPFTLSVHVPVVNFKGQKTELVQDDWATPATWIQHDSKVDCEGSRRQ